ncbi:flavohemoglobin expression-modulating QEGLA motif protein [Niabella defluvii]|nr:flavohemoglobin expression-modulating QEGLA motif protein [Niabella sp. I65]
MAFQKKRAQALLQHEIGTHVVTYYNGKAQPLELFSIGVPGYEELQEGLAVLAEYMTGGLTASRMRTLAARVVAVQEMISGKSFVDTFNLLSDKYGFAPHSAFNICMRVYRGGGLTKDAVYLKGFLNIIDYIKKGKDLKHLLVGKIREDYLPVVQELIHRNILLEAPVTPRFLQEIFLQNLKRSRRKATFLK